jgi:hypothetical protein
LFIAMAFLAHRVMQYCTRVRSRVRR